MNKIKKISVSALTVLSLATCIAVPTSNILQAPKQFSIISALEANAASGRLYNQNDSSWSSDLRSSGCGLFSMGNAIYALNGGQMDINAMKTWAKSNGYWDVTNGTYRDSLYGNITAKYGSTYGFNVVSKQYGTVYDNTLMNHLANGGVAVAHVGTPGVNGHFIALTGYNSSTGKYHVIDSVTRCAGSTGDAWQTKAFLSSTSNSNRTRVDWYALISSTGVIPSSDYFPRYTGNSSSIVEALNAIGVDSSYSYRSKIAAANGISNYSGTPEQNTNMLNKLKAGTLKRPGSGTTVVYFPKYSGSSTSIVEALNAVGADSSYSYRSKIAAKNGISGYSGTPAQNTTMLNKLKAGNLIKP